MRYLKNESIEKKNVNIDILGEDFMLMIIIFLQAVQLCYGPQSMETSLS